MQETLPLPEGYRIREFRGEYIPERWIAERKWWDSYIISHPRSYDTYKIFKTYAGAYRFLMKEIARKKGQENGRYEEPLAGNARSHNQRPQIS